MLQAVDLNTPGHDERGSPCFGTRIGCLSSPSRREARGTGGGSARHHWLVALQETSEIERIGRGFLESRALSFQLHFTELHLSFSLSPPFPNRVSWSRHVGTGEQREVEDLLLHPQHHQEIDHDPTNKERCIPPLPSQKLLFSVPQESLVHTLSIG